MVPRGAVAARGQRGPFKSGAAMICLVLGIFAGLFHSACGGVHERTFVAIKPDGVQRRLVGEIIRRFERKGLQLVGMKLLQASEELLKEHYVALRDRPFYGRLVKYMSSGPVVAMVWQGLDVVKTVRTMIGETNPAESRPGTIRGDFCVEVSKNVIHGSDSVESAQQEISLWFRPEELPCWEDAAAHWIYEFGVCHDLVPLWGTVEQQLQGKGPQRHCWEQGQELSCAWCSSSPWDF